MTPAKQNLGERIVKSSLLRGSFVLRSGQTSDRYFDKYRFESDPALLGDIAAQLVDCLPDRVDALAGLELGGIPLVTALSRETGIPARFVRKSAKAYGTRALAEGGEIDGRTLCIVEDIVSTGGQIIESTEQLRSRGAVVSDAVCVILRNPEALPALARHGLVLGYLLTEQELDQLSA